jgi:hypothetical protein
VINPAIISVVSGKELIEALSDIGKKFIAKGQHPGRIESPMMQECSVDADAREHETLYWKTKSTTHRREFMHLDYCLAI